MPEPGAAPGLVDVVQRWAAQLANTDGVSLPTQRLEQVLTGVVQDAVARAEASREAALRRFTALYAASPVGIALADPDGVIVEANGALGQFLGHRPDDFRGKRLTDLCFADRDANLVRTALAELEETDTDAYRQRVRLAHADDAPVWSDVTLASLPGDAPGATFPVLMAVDANEVYELQETLRHQSVHDALTGLANASRFKTTLESALSPSARGRIALIYLDIDGFKVINDGLGAGVGDKVLREIARKLKNVFTTHDALVARLSGDGFAVLLRGELTAREVIALVEQALEDLGEPTYLDNSGIGVSASVGIVIRDVADGGPEDLQRAAEIALHRAKEAGKAQWMLFDPELDARDRARYRLGAEIAGALENGEFTLIYHPTIKLGTRNEIAAVNASLRWQHREQGELEPDEFFPLAETTGMTIPLGKWLLTESLAAAARWHEQYPGAAPDMCINLPARLAIDPDLVRLIKEQLDKHELPASALRLCADPNSIRDPRGEVLESLSVLSDLGAKMVLTVTGSADLELIPQHDLKVRLVMFAGPVVDAMADPEPDPAAVRHLDQLVGRARELDLRIGAQGVRDDRHAARLRKHGVIAARGPFARESATDDEIDELIQRAKG